MNIFNQDLDADRNDMLKWISNRNIHIPMSEADFLLGIPPLDLDEDDGGIDE